MTDFLDSVLPSEPVAPTMLNPRVLVLYGGYKIGKSKISEWLSLNKKALWLDLEDGSEALGGMRVNVIRKAQEAKMGRVSFLMKLWGELSEQRPPRFDYMIIDKLDNLEEWAEVRATAYYKSTIIGANFAGNSVLELPKGGGYLHLQSQFKLIWNAAMSAAPHIVIFASLRDRQIDKADNIVSSNDLDLTGKVRKIAAGFADTLGFLYRESDGSNWVSFVTNETATFAGSRIARLEGKRFKLSWKDEQGGVVVDWKQIFVEAARKDTP